MEVHIRKLTQNDLAELSAMAKEKTSANKEGYADFAGIGNDTIFHLYVLPSDVRGSQLFSSYGYFVNGQMVAAIGTRALNLTPSWILSFIVTRPECISSMSAIKDLIDYVLAEQERKGYFHWYVVSANKRFSVWQRMFKHLRQKYHHFTYAVVPANQPPEKLDLLDITGRKMFPYDITISMYVSKSLCTS